MFSSASCLPMAVESAPQESFVLLLPTNRPACFHTTCNTCLGCSAFSRETCHVFILIHINIIHHGLYSKDVAYHGS